ncbi:hypothetical protein QUF64_04250 [Anaerolineales bacterium HSG6]|nr:hypothetical protein [Anaerolineales bacterium HSG6]
MSFIDTIKSFFSAGTPQDSLLPIHVRCRRCGEIISTRVNTSNDLSRQDDGGYVVRKTLIGDKLCFERIEVLLTFDRNKSLIAHEVSKGEFVTPEEYEAIMNPPPVEELEEEDELVSSSTDDTVQS